MGENSFVGLFDRTDIHPHTFIGEALGVRFFSLNLSTVAFIIWTLCFLPLSPTSAVYYPKGFDACSRKLLKKQIGNRSLVRQDEAYQFACNSVVAYKKTIIHKPCVRLVRALGRGAILYPL